MKFDIDGVHYFAEESGEGFPLILLHGFTGNSGTWRSFYPQWRDGRRLISIDIIGHGKTNSPMELNRYSMSSVVKDLKQILEQLQIKQTDILGYSMGGRLALSFAIQYPHLVNKLILESSSPGLETETEREHRRRRDEELGRFIIEQGIEKFVDYWENIPLFATQKGLSPDIQEALRRQRLLNSEIGLNNSLVGMGTGVQPSWWNQLHNLQAETLLLTGSLDEKFCFIAEKMTRKIRHCTWKKVENCGHTIHVENPDKFGTIIKGFLSRS